MHPASEQHIPDGLLAASVLLAEKPRQGSATYSGTHHQGFGFVISHTSLGIIGPLYDGRIRSRCTGKERDTESGLDYFGARYLSSSMGRFTSPDYADEDDGPLSIPYYNPQNPQSLNLYSYVRNNPVTHSDSDGHDVNVCTNDANGNQHCTQMSNDQYAAAQKAGNGGLNVPTLDQVGSNGNGSGQFNATNITDSNGNSVGTATYVSNGPTDYYANSAGYGILANASATVGSVKGVAAFYGASAVGAIGLYAAGATAGAELTTMGSLNSDLTVHVAERLAERGITSEAARAAIEAAKKSGDVVQAMGRYGPQLRYTANGIKVVVALTGANAGKIITAMWK